MEEKKIYNIVGTVTIGTDEYRDLLTEKFIAESNYAEQRAKWYEVYNDRNKLMEENTNLKNEIDKYKQFIKKNSTKIGEESIIVFMSMIGEG